MMARSREFEFAEIKVDKLILESFANEQSAYFISEGQTPARGRVDRFRKKLAWHISRSLSPRQREVIKHYLNGKKEREIAAILGITQQVVNIYKHRAIKRLHDALKP